MLEFLIDNIFDQCGGCIFQQTPLLADTSPHSCEADFITDLIQKKQHRLARSFILSFRYIDDVLLLNNPSFRDLTHRIHTIELEIKDTYNTVKSTSYLDLH